MIAGEFRALRSTMPGNTSCYVAPLSESRGRRLKKRAPRQGVAAGRAEAVVALRDGKDRLAGPWSGGVILNRCSPFGVGDWILPVKP
jgi:hypothetical protein